MGSGRRAQDARRRGDREPRTEAERRAAAVRATRGPRRTPRTPEREQEQIESRSTEQWIDEGSIRAEAEAATSRAAGRARERRPADVDPEVVAEIQGAVDPRRATQLAERLASAQSALDRERFDEARRMVAPLVRQLPQVAAVHEVNGLAAYRTGRWTQAAQSLELARQLRPDPSLLPVLADCYRALRRWRDVEQVWGEIKAASPPHDVMAEGRVVVASALADRGDLKQAIELLAGQKTPKRVREHHLRQWYVLADLSDRAGDTVTAARWFGEIAARDPAFADVRDRLRALGR
jgi:predicted Zn-dependent protease